MKILYAVAKAQWKNQTFKDPPPPIKLAFPQSQQFLVSLKIIKST